jgi:hypothetical protein
MQNVHEHGCVILRGSSDNLRESDWTQVAQNTVCRWVFVNVVVNLRFSLSRKYDDQVSNYQIFKIVHRGINYTARKLGI